MEGFKKLVENQSVTFEVGDGEKGPVKDIKNCLSQKNIF